MPINGTPALLKLKKQRFLCEECGSTHIASTPLVNKYCSLSNAVKLHVLDHLTLKQSEKDIARANYVFHSTVSKCVDEMFTRYSPDFNNLPRHLSFDEFKSTKDAKGARSFIFCDAQAKKVIDIVENRQLPFLRKYFSRFSKKARFKVETLCIDMYQPYISLIKELFPKARIIFDRFHIVNNLSRAFSKTRVDIMNRFKTHRMEYKRLKKYWKLLQKNGSDLDRIHFKKRVHFHPMISEYELVQYTVNVYPVLKETYEIYQTLLQALKNKIPGNFKKHLESFKNSGSEYMKTAIESLLKDIDFS